MYLKLDLKYAFLLVNNRWWPEYSVESARYSHSRTPLLPREPSLILWIMDDEKHDLTLVITKQEHRHPLTHSNAMERRIDRHCILLINVNRFKRQTFIFCKCLTLYHLSYRAYMSSACVCLMCCREFCFYTHASFGKDGECSNG